jgi:hypothetical protein
MEATERKKKARYHHRKKKARYDHRKKKARYHHRKKKARYNHPLQSKRAEIGAYTQAMSTYSTHAYMHVTHTRLCT